jgi:hypothetical protein
MRGVLYNILRIINGMNVQIDLDPIFPLPFHPAHDLDPDLPSKLAADPVSAKWLADSSRRYHTI